MKMVTGVIAAVGTGRILLVVVVAGGAWAIQAGSAAYLAVPDPRCNAYLPAELCTCPHATDDAILRAEASDRKAEDDKLFRNAPTEVSRMRRAEQIRRANGAPPLEEIPFIARPFLAIDAKHVRGGLAIGVTIVAVSTVALVVIFLFPVTLMEG